MINLLPQLEKETLHKEYRLRVIAVGLMLALFLVVLIAILLLPSFLLTVFKNNTADIIAPVSVATQDEKGLAEKVQQAKLIATALRPTSQTVTPSSLVQLIVNYKTSAIKIKAMTYAQKNQEPFSLDVRGVAQSRRALVDFAHALEQEKGIGTIELPVSALAKDSNIEFSFIIVPQS